MGGRRGHRGGQRVQEMDGDRAERREEKGRLRIKRRDRWEEPRRKWKRCPWRGGRIFKSC